MKVDTCDTTKEKLVLFLIFPVSSKRDKIPIKLLMPFIAKWFFFWLHHYWLFLFLFEPSLDLNEALTRF
jgi:hypothetical protein